jgi:hypothetical protein
MSQYKQQLYKQIEECVKKIYKLPDDLIYGNNFSISKLEEEADNDLKIDKERLGEIQAKAPVLFHRYYRIYKDFIKRLRYYTNIDVRLYRLKYEWYKNFYDFSLDKKTEIDIYVKGDEDILAIKNQCKKTEEIIKYLENICDRFSKRSFEIGNVIEWEKFRHGE